MSKKGRLSNAEKYVIWDMLNEGKNIKEIAEFLDRTPETIENISSNVEKNTNTKNQKNPPKDSILKFMTSPSKERGKRPVVMTEPASERGDASRQNNKVSRSVRQHLYDADGNIKQEW